MSTTSTMQYTPSPKALVIAGPPAAGKTTATRLLEAELGYRVLSLDPVNAAVLKELNLEVEQLRESTPQLLEAFKRHFITLLRASRYENIVLEGCRISHPHLFESFQTALFHTYGEYAILKGFYLNPDEDTRRKYYELRMARLAKDTAKTGNMDALKKLRVETEKGFCAFLEPVLPGFEVVESADAIVGFAKAVHTLVHPQLPIKHAPLIKAVAESGSFNPFYQRIEVNGETVIHGFTESETSWQNILAFEYDFTGKTVCDVGCMHGYYAFKAEEAGAKVHGVDISTGAIRAARAVAEARQSHCSFEVFDITTPFNREFDLTFALNVMHRVTDFATACRNIFAASTEVILEVGENQLPELLSVAKEFSLRPGKAVMSHRASSVVGQRILIHLAP